MNFLRYRHSLRNQHLGLLILRTGIGIMFMFHGGPKLFGGISKWESTGSNIAYLGIDIFPVFWGFMAGLAEFGGGVLMIPGLLFRPALFLMLCTMLVAANKHLVLGDGISGASHAIESAVLFLSLLLTGPGRYSLDRVLFK